MYGRNIIITTRPFDSNVELSLVLEKEIHIIFYALEMIFIIKFKCVVHTIVKKGFQLI